MTDETWQKVQAIFHEALSLTDEDRSRFLERSCSGDPALFSEVDSLLRSYEADEGILRETAVSIGLKLIQSETETTRAGTVVGGYRIGKKIGSGGMGEVYEAIDIRLKRKVALKFLPGSLDADAAAKRRLRKEAQAAAMLEHPNICRVYGIEEIDGCDFIVMQFVEGETLEKVLPELEITGVKFLSLATQIVEAVAAAHSRGIIHRDLKPGNIMLSGDGTVSVLDFGLAKLVEPAGSEVTGAGLDGLSTDGLVIGTVSYMSPEQLRGKTLDLRTDIFSLGIILYELLARVNPFRRETQAETMAAILTDHSVSASQILPLPPRKLVRLIDQCLERDREARPPNATEILERLQTLDGEGSFRDGFLTRHFGSIVRISFALLVVTALIWAFFFYPMRRSPQMLAIVPVTVQDLPPEKEYLADGLTQSLIEKLSNLSYLKVKNSSLVARFRGTGVEPLTAARELGADIVFSGVVRGRDGGLFLDGTILKTADGAVLDTFETKIDEADLIKLQESVTLRLLSKTGTDLTSEEKSKLAKPDTESPEAKRLYSLGRYFLKRGRGGDDVRNAAQYFFDAKEIDQNYARAWAGLADAYLSQTGPGISSPIPPEQAVKLAKAAATRALELDNKIAESYHSLGLIDSRYEWDWGEAEKNLRLALSIDPEFLPAHSALISVLGMEGRFDEALTQAARVKAIDPLSVGSDIQIAQVYYKQYKFADVDRILSGLLTRFPDNTRVRNMRVYQLLKTGRFAEAEQILKPLYESSKDESVVLAAAPIGFAYAKMGQKAAALRVIARLEELRKKNYVPAQETALIYVALGDFDKVFEFLDRSCREKYASLPGWITDPIVDDVKQDPRFEKIRRCVNL